MSGMNTDAGCEPFFEMAEEGMPPADGDGRISDANYPPARRPLGRAREDLIGRGYRGVLSPSDVGGPPGERAGLPGTRERVVPLGGVLEISSRPGVGASLAAEAPLPASGRTGGVGRAG